MSNETHDLTKKKCVPCEGGAQPLKGKNIESYLKKLGSSWKLVDEKKIEKEFKFPDFKTALAFTNLVGEVAEKEGHHPDIELTWGKVKITLWTHSINGLSENDFIVAAKCDEKHKNSK
jgi:4a-hydroxytetrahydrobiopterin dehydratase